MKVGFYSKLAIDGIKKNKKLYMPYIITCVLVIMMFYILYYLSFANSLSKMSGGASFQLLLRFGVIIIGVFSTIFLFYTNSFLIKRRKKEFGLYNILGMDKHGIGKVLFWETVVIYAISMLAGLLIGILLSKLFELGLLKLIAGAVNYDYSINVSGILASFVVYGIIFALILLNGIRQVSFCGAIELVKSESAGEKAPKSNWILGILGFVLIGVAYYWSQKIENALEAFTLFFGAVILVIIGTYFLLIAGSVLLCRLLQKNKNYYYQKNHFVSVSSMIYRMKRNGAGLASICILLTMILVIISSTTCLFFGQEDALKSRYPRNIMVTTYFNSVDDMLKFSKDNYIKENIDKICAEEKSQVADVWDYSAAMVGAKVDNFGLARIYPEDADKLTAEDLMYIYFISLEDYNKACNTSYSLKDDQVLAFTFGKHRKFEEISIVETGECFRIREYVDACEWVHSSAIFGVVDEMTLVVKDIDKALENIDALDGADYGFDNQPALSIMWQYAFNSNLSVDEQLALRDKLYDYMKPVCSSEECPVERFYVESKEESRNDFFSSYAGFFFLGIVLSAIFLAAAILIIYYKQITEGYEDQPRFIIMQKVGMTKEDIKKSINSQMLTVFFLPLILSVIHMAFAFKMVKLLLYLFGLMNVGLFVLTAATSAIIIAIVYALVYKITSNIYYSIVCSARID